MGRKKRNEPVDRMARGMKNDQPNLEKRFESKVEKLQRGDELAPGVMKMVKVFIAVKRKMQTKAAERQIQTKVTERLSRRKRLRRQESRLRRLSKRVLDVRNYSNQDLDLVGLVGAYTESTPEANAKVHALSAGRQRKC